VFVPESCSSFVLSSETDHVALRWLAGPLPAAGHVIEGEIESTGANSLMNKTRQNDFKARVDDFHLSYDQAVELVLKRCE